MNTPFSALTYFVSMLHCVSVNMAMGGAGLGACGIATDAVVTAVDLTTCACAGAMWGRRRALEHLTAAGFEVDAEAVARLPGALSCHYYAQKPASAL